MTKTNIYYNGKELDFKEEHEIIGNLKAYVTFINNSESLFEDISEVHWKYPPQHENVALESEIMRTGWVYPVSKIKEIKIINITS